MRIGGGAGIAIFLGGMYHSERENQLQIQSEEECGVQNNGDNYPVELLQ